MATQPKSTEFTPASCRVMSEAIQKALAPLEAKFGVTITMRGGRFDNTTFNPKIEIKAPGSAQADAEDAKANFVVYAKQFGLKPTDFGKVFFGSSGKKMKIVGLTPSRPKFPVNLMEVDTNKKVKATMGYVMSGRGR